MAEAHVDPLESSLDQLLRSANLEPPDPAIDVDEDYLDDKEVPAFLHVVALADDERADSPESADEDGDEDEAEAAPQRAPDDPVDDAQWIGDLQTKDISFDEFYEAIQSFAARKGEALRVLI